MGLEGGLTSVLDKSLPLAALRPSVAVRDSIVMIVVLFYGGGAVVCLFLRG